MTPTILIVEDDPDQRIVLRRYLRDVVPQPAVIEAETGAQAVRILRSDAAVHMVITDQRLPGGTTGMQVAAIARAHGVPAHVVSTDPLRLLSPEARAAAVDKRAIPDRVQAWLDVAIARAHDDAGPPDPPPAARPRRDGAAARLRRTLAHVATILGPSPA